MCVEEHNLTNSSPTSPCAAFRSASNHSIRFSIGVYSACGTTLYFVVNFFETDSALSCTTEQQRHDPTLKTQPQLLTQLPFSTTTSALPLTRAACAPGCCCSPSWLCLLCIPELQLPPQRCRQLPATSLPSSTAQSRLQRPMANPGNR